MSYPAAAHSSWAPPVGPAYSGAPYPAASAYHPQYYPQGQYPYPYGYDYYNQGYQHAGAYNYPTSGAAPPGSEGAAKSTAGTEEPPLPPPPTGEDASDAPPLPPGSGPPADQAPPPPPPPSELAGSSLPTASAAAAANTQSAPPGYDASTYQAWQQYYAYYQQYPGYAQSAGYAPPPSAPPQHPQAYPAAPTATAQYPPHPGHPSQQPVAYPQSGHGAVQHLTRQTSNSVIQSSAAGGASSWASSYNAVAPPPSLAASARSSNQQNSRSSFVIRAKFPSRPASTPTAAPATPTGPASTTAQQPAYVKAAPSPVVNSRPAAPAPQPSQPAKYPPSFGQWVERCFARCRTDTERQGMTSKLSKKIKDVDAAGRMWMVDWDTEPVPLPSEAVASSMPSPSPNGGATGKRSRWTEEEPAPIHLSKKQMHQKQQEHQKGKWAKAGGKAGKKFRRGDDAMEEDEQHVPTFENARRAARAGRFGDGRAHGGVQSWKRSDSARYDQYEDEDEIDVETLVIKGVCQDLEKSYFRLTAVPDPAVVRPEPVLRKALDRLVGLLAQGSVNYFYACDQFKALRQDCTVQHLRNEIAVAIYEAHGRSALEYGDLAEFNQCQTQLHMMYSDGVAGCRAEFVAYKILYQAVHSQSGQNKALLHTMKGILAVPELASCPEVQHALQAREVIMATDYPAFFRLYATTPNMGRAILDVLAPRMRRTALNVIVKGFKTSVPVSFMCGLLGFSPAATSSAHMAPAKPLPGCRALMYTGKAAPEESDEAAAAACTQWLLAHGAVLENSGADQASDPQLDTKGSVGKLIVPEEPKVSHGDENLSLDDFLSRASQRVAAL